LPPSSLNVIAKQKPGNHTASLPWLSRLGKEGTTPKIERGKPCAKSRWNVLLRAEPS
jgi:hypothetical protein